MKVLIINSVCNGSTGRIMCEIARDYIAKGNECKIAYGRGKPPKNIDSYKIGSKFSIYYHVFLTRLFDRHGFGSKHSTKKLVRWIKTYNPDLIWLHNIHGYYINIDILFKYLSNSEKKVKWTLHDCWSFTGHCPHFENANCYKWKEGCNKCVNKKRYPSSYLFDSSKRNYFDKKRIFNLISSENLEIITPSNWLKNIVEMSFLNKYKVNVINNKVDPNIFKRVSSRIKEKYNISDKKVILGVASVWDSSKGFDDFIELSKKISDEYKIVMIGLSEKQMKLIPDSILGIMRTENQQELVEWYSSAFCFFDPTYEDNYPTVLLEANSCGCFTYSYDTGGCKEIANKIVENVDDFIKCISGNK